MHITATELARRLKHILDLVQYRGREVVVERNGAVIARITPSLPHMTALEAMADLYRTLPEDAAEDWAKESREGGFGQKVRDPWAG